MSLPERICVYARFYGFTTAIHLPVMKACLWRKCVITAGWRWRNVTDLQKKMWISLPASPIQGFLFGCKYLNFSRSNSEMELIARRVIAEEEGENVNWTVLDDYADPDSDRYHKMVEKICKRMGFTSLGYNRLDDMLDAAGIDPSKMCTYCWNGRE